MSLPDFDHPMAITDTDIDAVRLREHLFDHSAGALVTFEGWVRDHNEGRNVISLDYEVYRPLAIAEGARIIAEVSQRVGVRQVLAVHREGALELGGCAVWVGVTSAHRDEAFVACREIIDRIKVELPIWKKEYYTDGDSGWVNCERCASHGHSHGHDHTHAHR
ncbi:MAG: molybdenum cofactor biosynthesis protein MoaE [Pseudomonadota bacterium]